MLICKFGALKRKQQTGLTMNDVFLATTLGKNITANQVSTLFAETNSSNTWQRVIFQLARELDKFPDAYRKKDFLIKNCEENVWLMYQKIEGRVYFLADSDSRVLKGLLAALLIPANSTLATEFSDFQQNVYLSELELENYLNNSEKRSLQAIDEEISAIFHGLRLS